MCGGVGGGVDGGVDGGVGGWMGGVAGVRVYVHLLHYVRTPVDVDIIC